MAGVAVGGNETKTTNESVKQNMSDKIKIVIRDVTPAEAEELLLYRNPHNRKPSADNAIAFANEMANGRWLVTHQGIALDAVGNLIDGQTRLAAICIYGKPVKMTFSTGWPAQTNVNGVAIRPIDVCDKNRVRSVAQSLQLGHGVENAACVAAIIRTALMCFSQTRPIATKRVTDGTTLVLLDRWRVHINRLIEIADNKTARGYLLGPLVWCSLVDPDKTHEFLGQYVSMDSMSSAVTGLRKWMENNSVRYATDEQCKVILYCFSAHMEGRRLANVRVSSTGIDWIHPKIEQELKAILSALPRGVIPDSIREIFTKKKKA